MNLISNVQKGIKVLLIAGMMFVASDYFITSGIIVSRGSVIQQLVKSFGESFVVRTSHPEYNHDLRPNIDVTTTWGGKSYRLCTNQYGFRSACGEKNTKLNNKHINIGFIGDSFTEGIGVEYEESFFGMFKKARSDLTMVNLAAVSYSPSIYLKKVEYLLSKGFTFDHLVVFADISDIQDEGREYEIRNNVVVQKEADSDFFYRMKMHLTYYLGDIFPFTFHFIDQVNRVWKGTGKESYTEKEFNEIINQRSRWTFDQQLGGYGSKGVEGAILQATDTMSKLEALLKENKIRFSLAVYPWTTQLKYGVENHRGITIWKQFSKLKGLNFIDINKYFFKEVKEYGLDFVLDEYFIKGDVHFNQKGHALVFKGLVEAFKKDLTLKMKQS